MEHLKNMGFVEEFILVVNKTVDNFKMKKEEFSSCFAIGGPVGAMLLAMEKLAEYVRVTKDGVDISGKDVDNILIDAAGYAMFCVALRRSSRNFPRGGEYVDDDGKQGLHENLT